jgi:hypothetical protein
MSHRRKRQAAALMARMAARAGRVLDGRVLGLGATEFVMVPLP